MSLIIYIKALLYNLVIINILTINDNIYYLLVFSEPINETKKIVLARLIPTRLLVNLVTVKAAYAIHTQQTSA